MTRDRVRRRASCRERVFIPRLAGRSLLLPTTRARSLGEASPMLEVRRVDSGCAPDRTAKRYQVQEYHRVVNLMRSLIKKSIR